MPDEKPHKYEPLPIPSYEEAVGLSAPSSSRTSTPSAPTTRNIETSSTTEREGLLAPGGRIPVPTRRQGYRPPPTDRGSEASDEEQDTFLGQDDEERRRRSSEDEEHEVRREMLELEIEDPQDGASRGGGGWGKRISSLTFSLGRRWNWRWRPRIPDIAIRGRFSRIGPETTAADGTAPDPDAAPEGEGDAETTPRRRFRCGWPVIDANFCIVLGRCFAILLVMAIIYVIFMSDIFTSAAQRMAGQMFDPESVRVHVQSMVDENRIREYLRIVTENDHVAGTEGDYVLAEYVQDFFRNNFLEDVHMEQFDVYLNYPKPGGRKVEILDKEGKVTWSAKIDEDNIYPERQQTAAFHGHSKTGDVTGPLIFANYGTREDYKRLYDSGIPVEGAIALVRYSHGVPELKVKAAEPWGFKGVIMYSDPADNGFTKGEPAPNGRYMPEGAVMRSSVTLGDWVVGDVLTPGWASTKGAKRIAKEDSEGLVKIPSLPLSWGDARLLLEAIEGFGQPCPGEWQGTVPGVEYWSGNLSSPQIHLVNDQDEVEQQPIWNVMGKITGVEQKEKSIIVGNHRDAWVYGATDPGSGTAVMLEVIRIFGDLVQRGWRPLRTIEFASWDGEEYNLIGSTEHVESNMDKLRENAYAYLNVDVAVGGNVFKASGSPVFRKSLMRVLDRTSDPYQNATMRQLWDERNGKLDGLRGGSDYVAFQDMAGTSSLDIGFSGPPFPYHSAYDNFEWMETVGDPNFQYHKVLAQIWALLILEFSDRLVLPFDIESYSQSVNAWARDLESWVENKGANQAGNPPFSTDALREAVLQFAKDSKLFEKWEVEWDAVVLGGGGFESAVYAARRKSHNNRMANFETHLLDLEEGGGIPNRTQFKHVVFGPQLWSTDDNEYFPAIRDAVSAGDWALAQKQVDKAAMILKRASRKLVGNN
ncbi:probable glutamate carboxypeptidase 2 [Phialocephala subalpina]|uniref:Probable glutamate carboxypeptidase 2 n=1 Tax=Phialocephala subalpina TaxID=576137 RepID=A0A1L7X9K4_9HELO|nr:probable glutamate carboxypeptidase 2 [Phialocephala subalpina]